MLVLPRYRFASILFDEDWRRNWVVRCKRLLVHGLRLDRGALYPNAEPVLQPVLGQAIVVPHDLVTAMVHLEYFQGHLQGSLLDHLLFVFSKPILMVPRHGPTELESVSILSLDLLLWSLETLLLALHLNVLFKAQGLLLATLFQCLDLL